MLVLFSPLATGQQKQHTAERKAVAVPSQTTVPVAFERVTVVDVQDGRLVPDQTVVVVGNRVSAVGSSRHVQLPRGARVVNGQGKYLMPGLWDMHVHIWGYSRFMYPLFITYGVTGIRGMSEAFPLDSLLEWQREVVSGTRVGPRQVVTGGYLQGEDDPQERADWGDPGLILATTPDQARRAVDSLKAAGADFIKFRRDLSRDVYFAMAAEARRRGIPFAGHRPSEVTAIEASDSGQRSLEHANELTPSTCWRSDPSGPEAYAAVAKRFAENGTWFVPTLVVFYYAYNHAPDHLRYWPASIYSKQMTFNERPQAEVDSIFQDCRNTVRLMFQGGAPLLAGTDTAPLGAEVLPGPSLHEELAFLVESGLTPLDALRTATVNPAKFFNATDSLGTVQSGKVADLVLLNANPLADIHNTLKIEAVMANGRYFDRTALDGLKTEVEQNAAASGKHQP